jgi:hypothetical protein
VGRTRAGLALVAALGLAPAVGCSAAVDPVGEGAGALERVDRHALESAVLFYDPMVSSKPLTAEELGDTSNAIEVRVRLLDEVAIAWAAPNGVLQEGRPGAIVAMYAFQTAVPTAGGEGSVRPETEASVPSTPPSRGIRDLESRLNLGRTAGTAPVERRPLVELSIPRDIWIRWVELNREDPRVVRDVGRYHPGCLEI